MGHVANLVALARRSRRRKHSLETLLIETDNDCLITEGMLKSSLEDLSWDELVRLSVDNFDRASAPPLPEIARIFENVWLTKHDDGTAPKDRDELFAKITDAARA